jgi:hypothetical protein
MNSVKWLREQAANDFTCEAKLNEIADEMEKLWASLQEEEAATEALEAKLKSEGNCACSYDNIEDICMCHSPKLAAAVAENDRLKAITWAQAGEIDRMAAENHRLVKQIQILQGRLYLNKLPHDVLEGTDGR